MDQITQKRWDYIIVGTGMGGGPVGLKLAQGGFSELFLEKRKSRFKSTALKGRFAGLFTNLDRDEAFNRKALAWPSTTNGKITAFSCKLSRRAQSIQIFAARRAWI